MSTLAMEDGETSGGVAETRPSRTRAWIAISAGTIGGFMALLDTSIANSALPIIQGEIGATPSEGTWIGTAYLTTEIVVIPLIAWLERLLGMRRMLFIAASVFTVFSIICGSATSLTMMIIGRLGQGISGGMMLPTAYSLVGRLLPPEEQSKAIAIISGPILIAPIIGPLLGGWLTENYSWHLVFFINVPISIVLLVLLFAGIEKTPGDLHELRNADWFGIAGMSLGLGALTVMLEEGHREQWFESSLIWYLAVTTAVGFVLITIGQLRPKRPVMKLALLRIPVVLVSMILLFVTGAIMFCILFQVPQFLIVIAGYNSFQAGLVILGSGISSFSMMLLYPALMKHADLRIMIGLAMFGLGVCCWITSDLTAQSGGSDMLIMQILMGATISLIAIPLQQMTLVSVSLEDIPEITSFVSVFRNIGGSIGLAGLASFREHQLEFHHWRLHETLGGNDPAVWKAIEDWSSMFGTGPEAAGAALRLVDGQVLLESTVMTFNDAFFALAILGFLTAPLAIFLRRSLPASTVMAGH